MTITTADLLNAYGYQTLEDWALDQNYVYDKHTDTWHDETRTPINLEEAVNKFALHDCYQYLDAQY